MAPTPIGAQSRADGAQRAIDQLNDLAGQLAAWLERHRRVSEAPTVQEALWALVTESMEVAGAESLLSMARTNQQQLTAQLRVEPELHAAVDYGISAAFVGLFLSPAAFQAKVRAAFDLLCSDVPTLDTLLKDGVFHSDLGRLQLEIFDSGVACQRSIVGALHLRQAIRAVIEFNTTLAESAGMVLGSSLLTAVGQKSAPYTTLRSGDASDHLRKAQAHPRLAPLFAGIDHHLRTAQAHLALLYDDESLMTDLRSGIRKYAYEDLIDSTFEAMESVLAGLAALRLAMSVRGIELAVPGLESLGFSPTDIARFILSAFGFHDGIVSVNADCLRIESRSGSISEVAAAIAAVLASVRASTLASVQVVLSDGNMWVCPTDAYATFGAAADEFEKQIALLRVQAGWRRPDGTTWLTTSVAKWWSANQVAKAMSLDTAERFRRLGLLRDFAVELGENELALAIRGVMTWARLELQGQQAGELERRSLSQIVGWGSMKVDIDQT